MNELMSQGLELMLTGIGVVFAFLIVLVVLMTIMSALINRFFPEPVAAMPAPEVPQAGGDTVPPHVLAVIQEAVRQHRARQG
ncbi:OadG family protein [Isoalcanivorax indicus]|uniref:OadG family protein n=1 Tax=Isoalcanivorax indicus TaxID=2202653 RepID=UPI000DB9312E|nr:OadG family transporter subunit [Isoalcanivorax indicus]